LGIRKHHKEIGFFNAVTFKLPKQLIIYELFNWLLKILEVDKLVNKREAETLWIEVISYFSVGLAWNI
jgi:hypothetical protein